jgi:hypothetical protein
MPHYSKQHFYFLNQPNQRYFSCNLSSHPCLAHVRGGNGCRCKNHTVIGLDYCRAHLRSPWALDITPSDNPNHGYGLRAVGSPNEVIFTRGQTIAYYNERKGINMCKGKKQCRPCALKHPYRLPRKRRYKQCK